MKNNNFCLNELEEYRKTWPDEMMTAEVADKIKEFMVIPKGTYTYIPLDKEGIDKEFNRLIGRRDESFW